MRRLLAAGAVMAPVVWAARRSVRVQAAVNCLRGRSTMYRMDAMGVGGPEPIVLPRTDGGLFAENHFSRMAAPPVSSGADSAVTLSA